MTAWVTPEQAADPATTPWAQAATVPEGVMARLLAAAQEACEHYAPMAKVAAITDQAPAPESYQLAVIYQARELWSAAKRDGDLIDAQGAYPIRARPLTAAVKALLRPQQGRPLIG